MNVIVTYEFGDVKITFGKNSITLAPVEAIMFAGLIKDKAEALLRNRPKDEQRETIGD